MGFFDKVKGFLNIGGPKVSILEVQQPITGVMGLVEGKYLITSTRAAKVDSVTQKLILEITTGKGEEKKTESKVLAEAKYELGLEIPENGQQTLEITIMYDVRTMIDNLLFHGGVGGAVAKLAQFAGSFAEKGMEDYYVEVSCDVVGTPIDPSDKMPVRAILRD